MGRPALHIETGRVLVVRGPDVARLVSSQGEQEKRGRSARVKDYIECTSSLRFIAVGQLPPVAAMCVTRRPKKQAGGDTQYEVQVLES